MRSILTIAVTALCVSGAAASAPLPGRHAAVPLDRAPVHGTITADETDWYRVDVVAGEEEIVAFVERGDLLLCAVDESTGQETGTLVTPEHPAMLSVREGTYQMSVHATTTTAYQLIRLPAFQPGDVQASKSWTREDGATDWPERETSELIRSAKGVIGRRWGRKSRSYELDVAAGYRAELKVACQLGAFEAMAIPASGRIVPLLLPDHETKSSRLGAGSYVVYLIPHTDEAEYSLAVTMSRVATPAGR